MSILIGMAALLLGFWAYSRQHKTYFHRAKTLQPRRAEHVHIHLPRAWFRWW